VFLIFELSYFAVKKEQAIFFPGLNEIRAFSALLVLLHHLELLISVDNPAFSFIKKSVVSNFFLISGENGVSLFFVLSGFLISYLLLNEKEKEGRVAMGKFYVRRILRIWPLYFIIVILSFFVLPFLSDFKYFETNFKYNSMIGKLNYTYLIFFVFFFFNYTMRYIGGVAGANQLWSVNIEEQFYLIWPWLVQKFTQRNIVKILITVILFKILFLLKMNRLTFLHIKVVNAIQSFIIEYMCVGAIGAILFYNHRDIIITWFKKNLVLIPVVFFFGFSLFFNIPMLIKAICFLLLIFVVISRHVYFGPMDFLGKISYGIYMFHPIIMYLLMPFCAKNILTEVGSVWQNVIVVLLIAMATIAISWLSFNYIEKPFLKLKDKFAV